MIDSRIQRIEMIANTFGRSDAGINSRHERALRDKGTIWNRVIGSRSQPSKSMARATSAAPLSTMRKTTNEKPKNAATISEVLMALLSLNPCSSRDRARVRSTRSVVYWNSSPMLGEELEGCFALDPDLAQLYGLLRKHARSPHPRPLAFSETKRGQRRASAQRRPHPFSGLQCDNHAGVSEPICETIIHVSIRFVPGLTRVSRLRILIERG